MTRSAAGAADAATLGRTPQLLAVDWGTSTLRGALLDGDGAVLAEHAAPRGLLGIPAGGWAGVFDAEFGAWRARWPGLRCLMAGMVGSRQGWAEAPYCACPASLADLAQRLRWVQPGRIAIVPGLSVRAPADAPDAAPAARVTVPDVMRGEETQVFGALQLLGLRDATLVLPGSHSKWVRVRSGRIVDFTTHLTGECYALLRQHSILARTLPAADGVLVPTAFDAGVARARQPGGLLHHLFGVRTLALFDLQPGADGARRARIDTAATGAQAAALASYLSGLVIGEELRAIDAAPCAVAPAPDVPVVVVGAPALCARYRRALAVHGVAAREVGAQATWRGLAALFCTMAA